MEPELHVKPERISPAAFVIAVLSYLPGIGLALGIIALAWAALSRRRGRFWVAVITLGGFALWGGLFLGMYSDMQMNAEREHTAWTQSLSGISEWFDRRSTEVHD